MLNFLQHPLTSIKLTHNGQSGHIHAISGISPKIIKSCVLTNFSQFKRVMKLLAFLLVFNLLISPSHSRAEAMMETYYIDLDPIVANFGVRGKMRYLRTNISIRTLGNIAATAIEKHRPYIRSNLLMLLSSLDEQSLTNAKGRESIRRLALEEVQAILREHEGLPLAEDLLFTHFIVQK